MTLLDGLARLLSENLSIVILKGLSFFSLLFLPLSLLFLNDVFSIIAVVVFVVVVVVVVIVVVVVVFLHKSLSLSPYLIDSYLMSQT